MQQVLLLGEGISKQWGLIPDFCISIPKSRKRKRWAHCGRRRCLNQRRRARSIRDLCL